MTNNTADKKNEPTSELLTIDKIKDIEKLSPMMRHYVKLKQQHSDCLLFYRLGDFYELFLDDALVASKELQIVLTARDCGIETRAPMCGVPFHSVEGYLQKLVELGYKVALCEQHEKDEADPKAILERSVVRIYTPGTVFDEDTKKNNYIMAISIFGEKIGFATSDVSTGAFLAGTLENAGQLGDELERICPAEIIVSNTIIRSEVYSALKSNWITFSYGDWAFSPNNATQTLQDHFGVLSLEGLGFEKIDQGVCAAGALLSYLRETQMNSLVHINKVSIYQKQSTLILDLQTRRNLEIIKTVRGNSKKGSLLWLLDETKTPMGARMLRSWVESPLCKKQEIELRIQAVGEQKEDLVLRQKTREFLSDFYDLERIASKIAYNTFNAKDAIALKKSLSIVPNIKKAMENCQSDVLKEIYEQLSEDSLSDLFDLLERSINEDPPISLKEGGIIKRGYNIDIDNLEDACLLAKEWLAQLEENEREATGIKNLKIAFNRVFGYYIEVTKSYLKQVPFRYSRKQTLANAERYIIPELKELEEKIVGAEEKSIALQFQLFSQIREIIKSEITRIQYCAKLVATLDSIASLGHVASINNFVAPQISQDDEIVITEGRHPIVEKMIEGRFTANDTCLNCEENRMLIITGPNMAGKSTYMRQVALICLMAHIGSYVSAKSAKISLLDRIFTRVGASDDLSSGKSTFMVEMSETANIVNNATKKSLILLDEIGRGTSTFDGLSIAWAVSEHIANKQLCGAKTLFSTHYHELSELEGVVSGVVNYRITAKEAGNDIVFLRKIVRGGAQKSFGIQVARLAGIPQSIIERAKELLTKLQENDINNSMKMKMGDSQLAFEIKAPPSEIEVLRKEKIEELFNSLCALDPNQLSPIQALNALVKLQEEAKNI